MTPVDDDTLVRLESAAFRRLLAHLRERTDVQNIDLMNLAGFCRNCLSTWLQEAAGGADIAISKAEAREYVYGMDFDVWKSRYQREATAEQVETFGRTAHPGKDAVATGR